MRVLGRGQCCRPQCRGSLHIEGLWSLVVEITEQANAGREVKTSGVRTKFGVLRRENQEVIRENKKEVQL